MSLNLMLLAGLIITQPDAQSGYGLQPITWRDSAEGAAAGQLRRMQAPTSAMSRGAALLARPESAVEPRSFERPPAWSL